MPNFVKKNTQRREFNTKGLKSFRARTLIVAIFFILVFIGLPIWHAYARCPWIQAFNTHRNPLQRFQFVVERLLLIPTANAAGCHGGGGSPPPSIPSTPVGTPTSDGEPVYLQNGEFYLEATDLVIPGRGLDFAFQRVYRAQLTYSGSLGYGWEFNYNKRILQDGSNIRLYHGIITPQGNAPPGNRFNDLYTLNGGVYTAPGFFDTISLNGNGTYTLLEPDGFQYVFYGFASQSNDGLLKQMIDRNGNTLTFFYSGNLLVRVLDTLSRNIYLAYDANGRITAVQDYTSRRVTYTYDADGNLSIVTSPATQDFPAGRQTTYTYSIGLTPGTLNHNLLTIKDPKGQVFLTNVYDGSDRVSSQVYGNGTYLYDYHPEQSYTRVTDRNGNIKDWFYNSSGQPSKEKVYSNGVNPDDPPYWETMYAYDSMGSLSLVTYPRGNQTSFTYDAANPDPKKRANLLSTNRKAGSLGVDPDIVMSYTYEPNFQFIKTATDPKGKVTTYFYDYEEGTLGDLNGDEITNQTAGNVVKVQAPAVTVGLSQPQQPASTTRYNQYGQVTRLTHPEGNYDVYAYYASGLNNGYLQSVTSDSGGAAITNSYTYDSVGNLTSFTDGKGQASTYAVNAMNQVTRSVGRHPLIIAADYTYDANGNVIRVDVDNKDENGNFYPNNRLTSSWTYDILNHPLTETREVDDSPKNVMTTYEYDPNENVTKVIEPFGNSVKTIYDGRNRPYQVTRGFGAAGASTQAFTYDANFNTIKSVDGRGKMTQFTYDPFDRLTQGLSPLGFKTLFTYDMNGNMLTSKYEGHLNQTGGGNVRLAESAFQYDELNREFQSDASYFDPATQAALPGDPRTTKFQYDQNSRLVKTRDDLNRDSLFAYDGMSRMTVATDPLLNTVTNTYDANSNVISTVEHELPEVSGPAVNTTTTFTYDDLDRLTTQVLQQGDPLSQTTTYAYDSRSNVVRTTDAKGSVSTFTYDGLSRQTRMDADPSITILQAWDDNSRLASQTDDNNHTSIYSYDALNRLTSTLYADATTSSQTYDANDNVLTAMDQNGSVVTNVYDDENRLTSRAIVRAPGVLGTTAETYGYDGLSRMTLGQDEDSMVTSTYDSFGQPRTETQNGKVLSRTFNSVADPTSLVYPGGRTLDQTFDALDRLQTITNGSQIVDNDYLGFGRVSKRTFGNGTQATVTYDTIRRITHLVDEKVSPLTTITDFQYGFDSVNVRLYEKKNHAPWSGKGDRYSYDAAYRLTQAKLGLDDPVANTGAVQKTIDYAIDGVNNRTSVTENGTPTSYVMDGTTPNPADSQMNQYTTVGAAGLTYDVNGNLKSDGTYQYVYDYRNQLLTVKDAPGTTTIASYAYDVLGRRINKIVGATTTKFYYSGFETVEERDGSDVVQATNVWGSGANELVGFKRSGQDYTAHLNSLGSVSAVTDSSGNVVERYDYDPYGKPTFRNASGTDIGSSAIGNPYLFTGQRFDSETGLYDYHNRMYSPVLGRFIQRDPIGTWTDPMNLGNGLAYVAENPINRTDPRGLYYPDRSDPSGAGSSSAGPGIPERDFADSLSDAGQNVSNAYSETVEEIVSVESSLTLLGYLQGVLENCTLGALSGEVEGQKDLPSEDQELIDAGSTTGDWTLTGLNAASAVKNLGTKLARGLLRSVTLGCEKSGVKAVKGALGEIGEKLLEELKDKVKEEVIKAAKNPKTAPQSSYPGEDYIQPTAMGDINLNPPLSNPASPIPSGPSSGGGGTPSQNAPGNVGPGANKSEGPPKGGLGVQGPLPPAPSLNPRAEEEHIESSDYGLWYNSY